MGSDFNVKIDPSGLMPTAAPQQKTQVEKTTASGHTYSVESDSGGVAVLARETISKTAHEPQTSQKFQPGPQNNNVGGALSTSAATNPLLGKASVNASAKTEAVSITQMSDSQKADLAGRALGFKERQQEKLSSYLSQPGISPENKTRAQTELSKIKNEIAAIKSSYPGIQSNFQGIQAAKPTPGGPPIIHSISTKIR